MHSERQTVRERINRQLKINCEFYVRERINRHKQKINYEICVHSERQIFTDRINRHKEKIKYEFCMRPEKLIVRDSINRDMEKNQL